MSVKSPLVQEESLKGPLGAAFVLLITKLYVQKSSLEQAKDYPKDYGADLLMVSANARDESVKFLMSPSLVEADSYLRYDYSRSRPGWSDFS